MSLAAKIINNKLDAVHAAMLEMRGMAQNSDAERFYMASRLRNLRTELSAVIKALEVEAPPVIKLAEGK